MARQGIALEIAALEPPIRPLPAAAHLPSPSPRPVLCRILKRGASMQYAAIIKHDGVALAQQTSVYGGGRIHKRGEARERVVELVWRVARQARLERRAVVHRGDARPARRWRPAAAIIIIIITGLLSFEKRWRRVALLVVVVVVVV